MPIRFLTSTDEHLADLAPGFRKDDYRSSILRKIEWQGELARKANVNAILRGGDFFHVKAANKTTHATIQLVAEIHKKFPCRTYSLAGNHDMSNNEYDSVKRQQPLGVLFRTGVFSELTEFLVEENGLRVRVVGIPYTVNLNIEDIQARLVKRPGDDYLIAVVHALAAFSPDEKIQSFFNEPIFDYRDLIYPNGPDVFVFGHYHKDQGIVDHLGVRFINLGSVSRGALTFENLDRKPKVSLISIDSTGVNVEEILIPCEDASQIFDLSLKTKLDNERKDLADFINKLKHNSTSDVLDRNSMLGSYPEALQKLALEILEAAEAGVLDV